ncbi:MAG TPA: hypothetical protein VF223_19100 [Trebonia sp.]
MTEKKPPEAATAAPGEKRSAVRPALPRASESGDPAVHKALGDLQTARQNLAAVRDVKREDEAEFEADEQAALARLAELGYGE